MVPFELFKSQWTDKNGKWLYVKITLSAGPLWVGNVCFPEIVAKQSGSQPSLENKTKTKNEQTTTTKNQHWFLGIWNTEFSLWACFLLESGLLNMAHELQN